MASAPQALPMFYQGLEPLSSLAHADYRARPQDRAPFLAKEHAIPLTVDEFALCQRFMPIVFSSGDEPIPLALMGLNEGINVFVDEHGALIDNNMYVPAYVRRYPYMLARLTPDAEELSLCFDPTYDAVGKFDDGEPFFEGGEPTEFTKGILEFNRMFEEAGARTQAFMKDLGESGLLIDGEVTIQPTNSDKPFIYRGFRMVDEQKLADLRGDQLRKMAQSGMLPLLYAHMFSLALMREIFERQMAQGKMPAPELVL